MLFGVVLRCLVSMLSISQFLALMLKAALFCFEEPRGRLLTVILFAVSAEFDVENSILFGVFQRDTFCFTLENCVLGRLLRG